MSKEKKCCESCGADVWRYPYEWRKRVYCSSGCYANANRGAGHSGWKGGRIRTVNGYILIYQPGHHRADPNGYVREQLLVMETKLGRPLRRGETTHHLNHIRDDNRPENLIVLPTNAAHTALHHKLGDIPQIIGPAKNGRWALSYDSCVVCGRTESPYNARGMCMRCYQRVLRKEKAYNARARMAAYG